MSLPEKNYRRDYLAIFGRTVVTRVGISLGVLNGARFVDIRQEFTKDGEQWWPTPKGVTLRAGDLDEAIAALQQAKRDLEGT